ncbi:hypothetical protein DV738_g2284, partial [Chaetothyriales sp. CBS 135597]
MLRPSLVHQLLRRSLIKQTLCLSRTTNNKAATTKVDKNILSQPPPLEEENLPWYEADQFYPVRIGEILDSRYKVVGKLGYSGYAAVKVCTRERIGQSESAGAPGIVVQRELQFYEHVSGLKSKHIGQAYIRGLLETFELESPAGDGGQHLCLVHPPMHMTIRELQFLNPSQRLNEQLLKWTLFNVLSALSFLHDEAGVVHADINPSNIMFTIADESILSDFEKAEIEQPSQRKVVSEGRTIYASRKLGLPKDALWGQPVLCDFGQALIGDSHRGLIQPELYRAPEVLFNMEWRSSVDIWNVAVLIWDLFENRHLFHALDENDEVSATYHVAEMVGYLGIPPLEYLQRSEVTKNVFDEQGRWKRAGGVDVPLLSLEEAEEVLDGDNKEQFLSFCAPFCIGDNAFDLDPDFLDVGGEQSRNPPASYDKYRTT